MKPGASAGLQAPRRDGAGEKPINGLLFLPSGRRDGEWCAKNRARRSFAAGFAQIRRGFMHNFTGVGNQRVKAVVDGGDFDQCTVTH